MFPFMRLKSLWLTISGLVVAASLMAISTLGLNFGLDFTGGTLLVVQFDTAPEINAVKATLEGEALNLGSVQVTPTKSAGQYLIRLKYLEAEAERAAVLDTLTTELGSYTLEQETTVGPTIGATLKEKALRALVYTGIAIVLYLAAVFRDAKRTGVGIYATTGGFMAALAFVTEIMVSADKTRWLLFLVTLAIFLGFVVWEIRRRSPAVQYGVCALVALAHDVVITLGLLVLWGQLYGVELDALTVTALLVILGFSVNDTIVVFDRWRENLKHRKGGETLADVADRSLSQTFARSVNTSVSTLLPLVALLLLGAESMYWFVATLLVGIVVGTYSSIFLATPLLAIWQSRNEKA
jgi:preprotein translocase subunit SecF